MADKEILELHNRFCRGQVDGLDIMMGYFESSWPAPKWMLVMVSKCDLELRRGQLLRHCPNCTSFQQTGPTDQPPVTYHCFGCGFKGPVPFRRYWEVLGEKLFELQFRVRRHRKEIRVSLQSPEIPEHMEIINELGQEIAREVQTRVSALQRT